MKVRITIVICILFSICNANGFGCVYNVRDLGFVDIVPNPYHLYCFIRDDTLEEITTVFKQMSYATFMDSNIEVEIINVDQKRDHPAIEYFRLWKIQSFPTAILVSPDGRSVVLPTLNPGKTFKESVRPCLEDVVFSQTREEILDHIVKAYCVILLVEGKDAVENRRAHQFTTDAIRKIAKTMSQLPKRIEDPPHLIVIPQELISKERILLWSFGLNENRADEPCVAVIYGRGRKIGPLFKGEQITGNRLFNILSIIGLSCECGLDKRWIMGPLLPLRWGKKIQSDVVKFLGFDAESPMVKMEMSFIMSSDFFVNIDTDDKWDRKFFSNPLDEYSEGVFQFESESTDRKISPVEFREFTSSNSTHSKSGFSLKMILLIVGIMALFILAGGVFILLRAQRKLL